MAGNSRRKVGPPVEPDKKPHMSPSQMESFCRCPEAYRRRYLEGEKIPPGIALVTGTCVHRPAEENFRQKIETHVDVSLEDFREMAAATFEDCRERGIGLTEDEDSRGSKVVLGEAKDVAVKLAGCHGTLQAPSYQPTSVEREVRIVLPNSTHDLLGFIDLETDKRQVIDFKNMARKQQQSVADTSVPLTFYAAGYQVAHGSPPDDIVMDVLVKTKEPYRQTLSTSRGPQHFQALANRTNAVIAGVKAGVFPPATPGAWWCSDTFCGYWRSCPYVNRFKDYSEEDE